MRILALSQHTDLMVQQSWLPRSLDAPGLVDCAWMVNTSMSTVGGVCVRRGAVRYHKARSQGGFLFSQGFEAFPLEWPEAK